MHYLVLNIMGMKYKRFLKIESLKKDVDVFLSCYGSGVPERGALTSLSLSFAQAVHWISSFYLGIKYWAAFAVYKGLKRKRQW